MCVCFYEQTSFEARMLELCTNVYCNAVMDITCVVSNIELLALWEPPLRTAPCCKHSCNGVRVSLLVNRDKITYINIYFNTEVVIIGLFSVYK